MDRQMDRQTDGQTDRQTDMTKLILAFRNFANALKSSSGYSFSDPPSYRAGTKSTRLYFGRDRGDI
jgi:hypothetical protein